MTLYPAARANPHSLSPRERVRVRGLGGSSHLPTRSAANAGFTLIELLLVLAILGILAAIVVPKFSGRTEQARRTAAESQIATFGTALDSYEVDMGTYPQGKDGLQQLIEEPRDNKNWKGPYLKSDIPKDPWGQPYTYEFPGRHNTKSYDLSSVGPDGREGTEDDVANWQTGNK
ncbi:MAG: type II secretion system major pseudopilin GspG [Verrucomicrobiales bacterium]|nr:type II secretion system major pseudopilin GspG [Verrucomicrobiales bacterium]